MNPVRELLRAGAEGLTELWLAEGGDRARAFADLQRMARDHGAKVRTAPRPRLDRLAGVTQHQGIVAVVADYRYREVGDMLAAAAAAGMPPLLVLLDGVEDPHNLGAVVRSAHALGAHGVVIPRDRAVSVTPAAAKASAGAVEHLAIAQVTNLVRTIEELKEAGIWTVAAVPDGDRDLASVDLRAPTALVIGGEGQGVRPLVRKSCDHAARIPMAGRVGSLNASTAAAIAIYEAVRQRGESTGKIPA
jgi:23S rRNA (guanosine2251-2'-O)-methyltransferase